MRYLRLSGLVATLTAQPHAAVDVEAEVRPEVILRRRTPVLERQRRHGHHVILNAKQNNIMRVGGVIVEAGARTVLPVSALSYSSSLTAFQLPPQSSLRMRDWRLRARPYSCEVSRRRKLMLMTFESMPAARTHVHHEFNIDRHDVIKYSCTYFPTFRPSQSSESRKRDR